MAAPPTEVLGIATRMPEPVAVVQTEPVALAHLVQVAAAQAESAALVHLDPVALLQAEALGRWDPQSLFRPTRRLTSGLSNRRLEESPGRGRSEDNVLAAHPIRLPMRAGFRSRTARRSWRLDCSR